MIVFDTQELDYENGYKYLVIQSGYTSRIKNNNRKHIFLDEITQLNELYNIKPLFIKDKVWGSGKSEKFNKNIPNTKITIINNILNEDNLYSDGILVFKFSVKSYQIFDLIQDIHKILRNLMNIVVCLEFKEWFLENNIFMLKLMQKVDNLYNININLTRKINFSCY